MKTMVVGISPDYNYPGQFDKWREQNTYYASNFGASFVTRSIIKQFSADYISNFSNIKELRKKYSLCIIAFATHITPSRDVSVYANLIEKLQIKTIILSIGVSDYCKDISSLNNVHSSMIRLLKYVSNNSNYIGVRGHYTASIIRALGFKNVIPIGCPTMYWRLTNDLQLVSPPKIKKPFISYHKTMAESGIYFLKSYPILGQDFQDEIIFTDNLQSDIKLKKMEFSFYEKLNNSAQIIDAIHRNGYFPKNFYDWFNFIGKHDFVISGRLHGFIASLIQGIPGLLVDRDLRTNELAEFYHFPKISHQQLKTSDINAIEKLTDFTQFNSIYQIRYDNYINFLKENRIPNNLEESNEKQEILFTYQDLSSNFNILHTKLEALNKKIESSWPFLISNNFRKLFIYIKERLKKQLKRIPYVQRAYRFFKN